MKFWKGSSGATGGMEAVSAERQMDALHAEGMKSDGYRRHIEALTELLGYLPEPMQVLYFERQDYWEDQPEGATVPDGYEADTMEKLINVLASLPPEKGLRLFKQLASAGRQE